MNVAEGFRQTKKLAEKIQDAYDRVRYRRQNYGVTFNSVAGQNVLMDLAEFCRANTSCFHADPRLHALAEGRREVWLRIANHINLKEHELFTLLSGGNIDTRLITKPEEDDND